eukprot:scaffold417116_cov46-Prasinocladus_malaysianus.AAC.2
MYTFCNFHAILIGKERIGKQKDKLLFWTASGALRGAAPAAPRLEHDRLGQPAQGGRAKPGEVPHSPQVPAGRQLRPVLLGLGYSKMVLEYGRHNLDEGYVELEISFPVVFSEEDKDKMRIVGVAVNGSH